jgi:hypothetical protein
MNAAESDDWRAELTSQLNEIKQETERLRAEREQGSVTVWLTNLISTRLSGVAKSQQP